MKYKILILLIFNFLILSAQNNRAELEVTYYFKISSDSLNRNKFIESEMILLCNSEKSIYYNPEMAYYYEYLKDFAKKMDLKNLNVNTSRPAIPKVRHNIWKEGSKVTASIPIGMYFYKFNEPDLKWELINEKKIIHNMECNLAKVSTENDVFYAWYNSEIPFSEGPFRFKGLPGLILEVYNENKTIEFIVRSIKKSDRDIEKMASVATIDVQDKKVFFKARDKWLKYPFDNAVSKEREKQGIDEVKKMNVFLD